MSCEAREERKHRGAEPLPPGQGDVSADDGDQGDGGLEMGDERLLHLAEIVLQIPEDAVDVRPSSFHGQTDSTVAGFSLSTTAPIGEHEGGYKRKGACFVSTG